MFLRCGTFVPRGVGEITGNLYRVCGKVAASCFQAVQKRNWRPLGPHSALYLSFVSLERELHCD